MSSVHELKPDAKYERNSIQSLAILNSNGSKHCWSNLNNTLQIFQIFLHLPQPNHFIIGFHDFTSLTWNLNILQPLSVCLPVKWSLKKKVLWSQSLGHAAYYVLDSQSAYKYLESSRTGPVEFVWLNISHIYWEKPPTPICHGVPIKIPKNWYIP